MSTTVIKITNLSKQYRLGYIGAGTLKGDFQRWASLVRGIEDPFLKIGTEKNMAPEYGKFSWALRDINLDVKQGDVLGIIGNNGAGKSTLLKILSRITGPTTGAVNVKGRIASLLEVGTGFHPELSGRENIFLNGAILGMRKNEIKSKLDEIVDFAGVSKYIDTPVKRYSSGMHVRLAFAVAAHLDPEILIIDEVLAVGDAEFQKKAIGKMKDVSSNEGRTVLFVSHNMTSVENLCSNICILKEGKLNFVGQTRLGIAKYLNENQNTLLAENKIEFEDDFVKLVGLHISQDALFDNFLTKNPISVLVSLKLKKDILGLRIGFDVIDDVSGAIIFRTFHDENDQEIKSMKKGDITSTATIPADLLKEGSYTISLAIGIHNSHWIIKNNIGKKITIHNIGGINNIYGDIRPGVIMPKINWKTF